MDIELGQILEERDFSLTIDYPSNLGNTLSRGELEDITNMVIGQPIPNNTVRFVVRGLDNKYFLVYYVKPWDKFLWERLTAR